MFLSLLIVEFQKNKQAALDACWQADVIMTLREAYVKFFENEWLADRQADFSFLNALFIYNVTLFVLMFTV